jgi:parallel beta-helix repeat protein
MSHVRTVCFSAMTMVIAALFTVVASPAASGAGAVLGCGSVITEDTVLGADIGPCGNLVSDPGAHVPGGHGIVIRADGVTLDLNGHTIFGLGGAVVLHQATAVVVDGHSDVTVRNGTVRDFFHGVQVINGSRNVVTGIRSIDNTTGNGIVLQNAADSSVVGNMVVNSGGFGGISVFSGRAPAQWDDVPTARNTIANNLVDQADNRTNTAGISLENGPGHRVLNNAVTNSSGDGINLRADNPIAGGPVLPAVTNAVVSGNTLAGNGKGAASIAAPVAGIALRLNPATGVGANGNQITGNRLASNADHGIYVASRNNVITNNQVRGSAVHDLHDANLAPPCDNNVWRANAFGTFNQACVTG